MASSLHLSLSASNIAQTRTFICRESDRCNRTWTLNITTDDLTASPAWACDLLHSSLQKTGLDQEASSSSLHAARVPALFSSPTNLQVIIILFLCFTVNRILSAPSYALPFCLPRCSKCDQHCPTCVNPSRRRVSRGPWLAFYALVLGLESIAANWMLRLWWRLCFGGQVLGVQGDSLFETVAKGVILALMGAWLVRFEGHVIGATWKGMQAISKGVEEADMVEKAPEKEEELKKVVPILMI